MIALKHALPLIRNAHGNAVAFESTWLRGALQDAARQAGYDSWWMVDDLIVGISLYLRNCYVKNVIDLPELESLVCTALRNIGYAEVAIRFRALPPTRGISLVQFLKETPAMNCPVFFDKLAETITTLYESKVRHFHFYDLHACSSQLESDTDLDRDFRPGSLREKIVSFVRERVRLEGWSQSVWCSIS